MNNCLSSEIIIIGGGTSGAVIAKQLANKFDVTVLEQSENKRLPIFYRIPLMIGLLFSKRNEYLNQKTMYFNAARSVPFFESRVLGGTSVINGCVHVVGSRVKWKELLSRFHLELDDLYASYNNLYSKFNDREKIAITEAPEGILDSLFFGALRERGIGRGDVEWADLPAYGPIFNTVRRIFRSSVMSLRPFSKCVLRTGVKVECLVVDDNTKVIGVYADDKIMLSDVVICSAGVIGTNSLLRKKALRFSDKSFVDLHIDTGRDIKDHTNLRINVEASLGINSLNEISSSYYRKMLIFAKHVLGFKTLMRGTGATSAAQLDLDGDGEIDTRIQMLNFAETGRMGSGGALFSNTQPGFSISITAINPKSLGGLALSGGLVNFEPNYLSNGYDIDHLKKCLIFVVDLLESKSFGGVVSKIDKIEVIKNDPERYIIENSYSGYHLIGGSGHLIDKNFKVNHLDGLYICDASIMTDYVSSNIHSVVAMLGDMFAKRLIDILTKANESIHSSKASQSVEE